MPAFEHLAFCAVIAKSDSDADIAGAALILGRVMRKFPHLRELLSNPGSTVLASPELPTAVSPDGNSVILGDAFARSGTIAKALESISGVSAPEAAKRMVHHIWGRYALFCIDAREQSCAWLRDPSGAQRLYAWRLPACMLVTNAINEELIAAVEKKPNIDWHQLSMLIARPEMSATYSALRDVDIALPGELYWLSDGREQRTTLWSPVEFAASERNADSDELIAIGTECVARWLDGDQRITIELSGGLDSSLVAGLAATLPSPPIIQGLNLIPRSPGGDERSYARSVSDKWGFGLIEASIDPSELNYLALMDRPLTVEPPVYGMDVVADGLSSDLAETFGATRILSGQGGDAVFFQPHTPLITSDYLKAKGTGLHFASLAKSCAMATNRSIWSVMREAIRPDARLARRTLPANVVGPVSRIAWEAAPLEHPWVIDAQPLPAGKQMQIAMLANCLLFHGFTQTGQGRKLVHPLLSQPLVELCLGYPLWQLVPDQRERGMARDAFAPVLPQEVLERQGKGEASGFYNLAIAAHLEDLRPLLLKGVLSEKGLIEASALDAMLDRRHLLWKDDHPLLAALIALECWVRRWA